MPDDGDQQTGQTGQDDGGKAGGSTGAGDRQQQAGQDDGDKTDWRAKAREWERRANSDAKKLATAQKDLDDAKTAAMSDADKAVKKARDEGAVEGRKAALAESSGRMVKATMRGLLAGRDVEDADDVVRVLDHSHFLTAEGEPDDKAIREFVDKHYPADRGAGNGRLDLGQGRRQTAKQTDMNSLIRAGAGRR